MDQTVVELPVADKAWAWFQENQQRLVTITMVVLVVAAGISFYMWRQGAAERAAGNALSEVEAVRSMAGANNRIESPDGYLKVANEHAGSKAAARALLLAAGAQFVQGQYADAQTTFQRFLSEYPDNALRGQASLGVAACLDGLGKTEEAATAYKNILDRNAGDSVIPSAKFALARIYEAQGKFEQASRLYEELSQGGANGTIATEAGLKVEELRPKVPAAAPVTASPAVPAVTIPAPATATNQPKP